MKRLLVKAPKEAPSPKAKGKAEKKADKADKPAGQGSPAAEHKAPAARKTKKGKPAPQIKIASWNLCNLVEQSRHKKYNVIAQVRSVRPATHSARIHAATGVFRDGNLCFAHGRASAD